MTRGQGQVTLAQHKKKLIAVGAVVLLGVAAAAVWLGRSHFAGRINALGVDLQRPAAYVATPSLVKLSQDLVKAPVLRELLTEDFTFYYEAHEDKLGLAGAIRRIAYEHDTKLSDELLTLALDQPAEVALWADDRGAARHWALAMTRDTLAKAVQGLATLALDDKQLSVLAEVPLARFGRDKLTVYALTLSPRRTLALAAKGNRVVVLSDPGLLFDDERNPDDHAAEVLSALLSGSSGDQGLWRRHFGLAGAPGADHTLVASGPLLAFGYQHFFPALKALRVDVAPGGTALHTWLRQGGAWPASPWAALPSQPAACAALPVNWALARPVLDGSKTPKAAAADAASDATTDDASAEASSDTPAPELPPEVRAALTDMAQRFDGPAAVCWYAGSQLHTPLLVAHAKGTPPDAATLQAFMQWWLPSSAAWQPGQPAAEVSAPYGAKPAKQGSAYRLAFKRAGDWWLFSPDAALVAKAEDAIARRYPSVADTLGGGNAVAVATPAQIAELMRRETLAVLGANQQDFRQAAETQLLPRLAAFGKLPAAQAVPTGTPDGQGWVPLDWRPLAP
ncbi:DUF2138 domain-containing protein [Ideonella azotifigens]|uniref:DUF2138 domain-containing protein n=1 Tax=Ideonella azotifigens TaxID=513160 RepID=A0ABN1KB22_9BURK